MRAKELEELSFQIRYVERPGEYLLKPYNARTVKQLLADNLKPKNLESIEYFEMPYVRFGKKQAYPYVREENVVPFDEQDYKDMREKQKEKEENRLKIKEEKAKEKVKEKAKEKEDKRVEILRNVAKVFEGNVLVFDTETTGFSPAKGDEILQISITDKYANVLYESYIKPMVKKQWYGSQQVHGITPQMVSNAPSALEVRELIKPLFENADVIVGHNVSFDLRFIEALGIKIDNAKVYDTMKIYKADMKSESYSLENAVKEYCPIFYSQFVEKAHNSTMDTCATAKVFEALAQKGKELLNTNEINMLNENSKEDELYNKIMNENNEEDLSYF